MRRALAVLAVAAVVLTGCAQSDDSATAEGTAAASSPAESPTPEEPPTEESPTEDASASPGDTGDDSGDDAIEIEIEGDRIEPNGMRVKVEAGETITFQATSDRATELHVHSSPEQVLEVEKGSSTLTLVVDRPGLVDIEEHGSGMVLLQLEVR